MSLLLRIVSRALGSLARLQLMREALAGVVIACFLLICFVFFWPSGVGKNRTVKDIHIPGGWGVGEIGQALEREGVISDCRGFAFFSRVLGVDAELKAGRYELLAGSSCYSVLKELIEGGVLSQHVTIPEGLRVEEVAGIIHRAVEIDSSDFVRVAHDKTFCRYLGVEADNLEGYLFPETYDLYWKMEALDVIGRMVKEFWRTFGDDWMARTERMGLTVHQVVTLASLVEEEVRIPEELPLVSAVFHNRLKLGMPLQCDPTVVYALPRLNRPLLERDLYVDSPYNTYLHVGLPPGPISNPGRAALEATLYPDSVDYLYFIARGDGGHVFSRTNQEHIQAKWRIRGGPWD